jgi:hypothetical protein
MTQFLSCAFIGIEKTRSVSNRVVLFRLALRVLVVVVTCAGVFFTRQWVVSFEPNPLRTTRPRKTHRVPRLRGHQKAVLVPPAAIQKRKCQSRECTSAMYGQTAYL